MMTETTAEIVSSTTAPGKTGKTEPSPISRQPFGRLLALAAGASVVAGLVHYVAAAEHRSDWEFAAVLTLVGAFQIVWAVWLWVEPKMRVIVIGISVNALAVAIWVVSRTAGLPLGHHAGEAEVVGLFDVVCVIVEAVVVAAMLFLVRAKRAAAAQEAESSPLS